jgi:hypothetical protein
MAERRVQVRDLRDAPALRPQAAPIRGYFQERTQRLPDSELTQVAKALRDVNPTIQRIFESRERQQNVEDIAEAQRQYQEVKKPLRQAIRDGDIREGQSPAFQQAWREQSLRARARDFGAFLRQQYANSPVSQSTDPEAVIDFTAPAATVEFAGLAAQAR